MLHVSEVVSYRMLEREAGERYNDIQTHKSKQTDNDMIMNKRDKQQFTKNIIEN